MSTRIGVIGCGAVGGYYGGCLQRAGHDVHFLAHSDVAHLRAQGLRVDSKYGDFVLPTVQVYDDPQGMPVCDIVMVALKSTENHVLADMLPHLLGPDSTVLLLQNGLGQEDRIATMGGVSTIVSGLCFLCSNKLGPGHIHHLDYGYIAIGEYAPDGSAAGITPAMQQIRGTFEPTGIPIEDEPDLLTARWKKLVWNVPYNGLSVIHDADTRALMEDPATRRTAEAVMREVVEAGSRCARPIPEAFIQRMLDQTVTMAPYRPSMKLDFDAGRPLEIDSIYGVPLARAAAIGVDMPETRAIHEQLVAMRA